MNKNFLGWLLATLLLATASIAEAQQPAKVSRIGYLSSLSPTDIAIAIRTKAFQQGLRDLGYVEGKNLIIEYRYAERRSDRVPALAAELVRLKVNVIVSSGNLTTQEAKKATKTIPIVMTQSSDPVVSGFVASLARPGSNLTRLSNLSPDLGGKRLELLKELVPRLSRVAVLLWNPVGAGTLAQTKVLELAAPALGLKLQRIEVQGRDATDLESAFTTINRERPQALIGSQSPTFAAHRGRVAELAVKSRLPTMYADSAFPEVGGMASYGASSPDLFRRAATYVDKILKGAKPAELPVEQPTKFEFVVNLKTAKQIGLTIPPNVLARADRVIR